MRDPALDAQRAAGVTGVAQEVRSGVTWLRLDRPPRNLLDPGVLEALRSALEGASDDPAIRAIVLTGSGDVFCGGLDIPAIRAGADPHPFARGLVTLLRDLPALSKPVVAAVNGDAVASGFSIVCACDYAIAVEGATLGTIEAGIGSWPMIAQVPPLKRLLPRHAIQNIVSGVPFDTADALRFGAINRVVVPGELERTVVEFVEAATRSEGAVALGRPAMYRFLDLSYNDALDAALKEFTAMLKPATEGSS
jgi:enoyl-CoA hydratase/carnithine racemase